MQPLIKQRTHTLVKKVFSYLSLPQIDMLSDTVAALFYNDSISLRNVASNLSGTVNVKHKLKKLQYFLDGMVIDEAFWKSYITLIFSLPYFRLKSRKVITLALDATTLRDDYWLLAMSVTYCGRAIPVVLHTYRGVNISYDFWERVEKIVQQAKNVLPKKFKYEIVADRGFDGNTLINICKRIGWDYVIRINGQYKMKIGNQEYFQMDMFADSYYQDVLLGVKNPIKTNVTIQTIIDEKNISHPWYLAHSHNKNAADIYKHRFWIEESFKDLKGVLKWEKYYRGKIPEKDRLAKLVVISCLSYSLQLCLGSGESIPPSEMKKTSVLRRFRHILHSAWMHVNNIYKKVISNFRVNYYRNHAIFFS